MNGSFIPTEGYNDCPPYSRCTDDNGIHVCSCVDGYEYDTTLSGVTLDGTRRCHDRNECNELNTCHEYANCINVEGSYYCFCNTGFTGDGKLCTDVDECETGSNVCDDVGARCYNNRGSYDCKCIEGFTGDGILCDDHDECGTLLHRKGVETGILTYYYFLYII